MQLIFLVVYCLLHFLQFNKQEVLSSKIRLSNLKYTTNHVLSTISRSRCQNVFPSSTSLFQLSSESDSIDPTVVSVSDGNSPSTVPLLKNKENDEKEVTSVVYTPKSNWWKSFLLSWSKTPKEFSKETLAKLGLNVLLAYGFISNVAYITCFIIAWVLHGKTYGLSPLAPGSWKSFLLIYSGFVAVNNLIRPLRYGVSLAISPLFSKLVDAVEQKTGYKRATATSIVVFMVNIIGSTSYMGLGLLIATRIFAVPLFPPRVVA